MKVWFVMKKILFIIVFSFNVLFLLFGTNSAFALESDVSYTLTQEQINTEFEGLSDNQTVVALPDGGIIFSVNQGYVFSNEEVTQNQGYVAIVGQLKDEYQTKEFVTSVSVIPEVPLTRAAAPSATAKVLRSG